MGLDPRTTKLAQTLLRASELHAAACVNGVFTKTDADCAKLAWVESCLTTPWLAIIEMLLTKSKDEALRWAADVLRVEETIAPVEGRWVPMEPPLAELFRRGPPERIASALEEELTWRRESGEDDPETGVMYKGVSFR